LRGSSRSAMVPADSFVGYERFWADGESRLPESAVGGFKSRRDPIPVCEDLPSRIVARCAGDPASGVGSGSAQVQALDRRAISGPSGNRSQDEGLVERHLPVIDVSLRKSESALQVSRGQHLSGHDEFLETRQLILDQPNYFVAEHNYFHLTIAGYLV